MLSGHDLGGGRERVRYLGSGGWGRESRGRDRQGRGAEQERPGDAVEVVGVVVGAGRNRGGCSAGYCRHGATVRLFGMRGACCRCSHCGW